MADSTNAVESVQLHPHWIDDLNEDWFRLKHKTIIDKLLQYDAMLMQLIEKSDLPAFSRCMDRIINRYLPKEFKADIDKICFRNICLWAMPLFRKSDPNKSYLESIKAYRLAVLSFMPNAGAYLQAHPAIYKNTVEF